MEQNAYAGRQNICTFTLTRFRERREMMMRKNLTIICSILFVLAMYSIVSGQGQLQQSQSTMSEYNSMNSYGSATSYKYSYDTASKGEDTLHLAKRFMRMQEIVRPISGYDALLDATSPQFLALDWIANRDTYRMDPDDPLLIQRYALAVLYFSTNGKGWKKTFKWLTGVHECEWKADGGVRQCNEQGEITDLSLWNNLKGTIPSELMQLSKLEVLYLSRNELWGTIPPEIGNLRHLTYLGLQHNKLSGTVPQDSFTPLTSLKFLYLEKNDLTGTIRRIDYPCLLMKNKDDQIQGTEGMSFSPSGQSGGSLEYFTADCRALLSIKKPEITCACCTQCYLA